MQDCPRKQCIDSYSSNLSQSSPDLLEVCGCVFFGTDSAPCLNFFLFPVFRTFLGVYPTRGQMHIRCVRLCICIYKGRMHSENVHLTHSLDHQYTWF